jgi:hypothetical protein
MNISTIELTGYGESAAKPVWWPLGEIEGCRHINRR